MKLIFVIFAVLLVYKTAHTEYCIEGEDEGCRFECHCANDNECREGTCPGGCHTSALGYNWRGPACQIGNVGLHKEANMTVRREELNVKFPPTGALDGQIVIRGFNSHCADLSNVNNLPAEWWADLGDIYKIYNITVYGRRDCCEKRLQHFDLTIYNTSDNEVLCAYHRDIIYTKATIRCNEPVIGRYVHFKRKGGPEIDVSALCEVVVIGHKVYDCSNCPLGVTCNDVTGCQACRGSYQPECKPECRSGSYGINCNQRCGHCKSNNNCHKVTGQCLDGCQLWWAGDSCFTYIDKPVHKNERIEVLSSTSDSIKVTWEKFTSISANLSQFYGYVVLYKDINTTNYTEFVSRRHDASKDGFVVEVQNLNFNTKYDIQVWPYREMNGERDFGSFYQTVHAKTTCKAPQIPAVLNVTLSDTENEHWPNITVFFQRAADLSANCHEIISLSLNYKLSEDEQFSQVVMSLTDNTYTIIPDSEGRYQIWITVTNNEGYSSQSDKYIITIKRGEQRQSNVVIIAVSVAVVAVIAVIVCGIAFVWIKRRKSNVGANQSVTYSSHADTSPERNMDALSEHSQHVYEECLTSPDLKNNKEYQLLNHSKLADDSVYSNSEMDLVKFESYVLERKNQLKQLFHEFETLPKPDLLRCQTTMTHLKKQKYNHPYIYPYDDNAVTVEREGNNIYINASYIQGYTNEIEYIAAKGAEESELIDFWHMVWNERSIGIVTIATLKKTRKQGNSNLCPRVVGETLRLDDIIIKTESVEISADYITRILTVKKASECRTVRQFHFTTWEDNGVPQFGAFTLLPFMKKVRSFGTFIRQPLIVHCSNGVGRTGTYIALDILQQMATKKKAMDVYSCVQKLRNYRMYMVETKEQYLFLHDALVEFIKLGNTSYDYSAFIKQFRNVSVPQPNQKIMAILNKEFKFIYNNMKSSRQERDNHKDQTKNENHTIWSTFVDSFEAHDSFIVTEMPSSERVDDFWKFVLEQRCQALVMLNELDNTGQSCEAYWPNDIKRRVTYGEVEVELLAVNVDKMSDFIVRRDFQVTSRTMANGRSAEIRIIRHFQLLSWPDTQHLPPERSHLLELIEQLQRWQQENRPTEDMSRVLVHCSVGGSRSGMFCGASFMLEKMKIEQDVNVYLAVRSVSRRTTQFFTNIVEYRFLYQLALDYLLKNM